MPKWKTLDAPVQQPETFASLIKGRVKRIDKVKGFGFIIDDSRTEYFFHRSAVRPTNGFEYLDESSKVEFEPTNGAKGPRAEHVQQVG